MIVPKLDYAGEVWEGNAKLVKQLKTIQMRAAKRSTRMLKFDEVLQQYKEQNWKSTHSKHRDVRMLKGQHKVRNMPKKRLPAIADRVVLEEVTKVPAGIRWDSVVEKVWMDRGGNQQEVMSVLREVCGVREWNKRNDSNKGKANANQQGEGGATLEAFTGG